ncbi:MAG: hypothetical protein ACRD18_05465 [Terriglobia bacterium]
MGLSFGGKEHQTGLFTNARGRRKGTFSTVPLKSLPDISFRAAKVGSQRIFVNIPGAGNIIVVFDASSS